MDHRGLLWESGRDETVEVNQRALIDKVLARYSGEFTVFRELLQNADDAGAKRVEICFETQAYLNRNREESPPGQKLPDLKSEPIHQWVFKNDGIPFREEDWSRLKKIADGNPDEQKIGAFGVGFYSLFSVTEEPVVKSGNQWMLFYWKDNKDQLFVRRGPLTDSSSSTLQTASDTSPSWTTFEMTLREPSPLPDRPVEIARFLSTSLTFMTNLRSVSLHFDGHCLARISKETKPAKDLVPPYGLTSSSPGGMMSVRGINSTDIHIKASIMRWVYSTGSEKPPPPISQPNPVQTNFFSSLWTSFSGSFTPDPAPLPVPSLSATELLEIVDSSVQLTIFGAFIDVRVDRKMAVDLERATKKKPPVKCTYQLIYTGKGEYDASKDEEKDFQSTGSVFQGLRADIDGKGAAHIFIGHATSQTTGIGGHVAARFIPTVERESIDLVDRNVSQWNKELLFVGGYLARAVYELQINKIKALWDEAPKHTGASHSDSVSEGLAAKRALLQATFLHNLCFFTFHPSTPSATVSQLSEAAFFSCAANNSLPIMSTIGIKDARHVRLHNPTLSGFIKQLPTLPIEIAAGAKPMVASLRQRGLIRDISYADVIEELQSRPLAQDEMTECLQWRINLNTDGARSHGNELRDQFLSAGVFSLSTAETTNADTHTVIALASIRTYFNPRSGIPADLPTPSHTLPFVISKNLPLASLGPTFGWAELSVVEWLANLTSPITLKNGSPDGNLTTSQPFAERVLGVIARAWTSLNVEQHQEIIRLLTPIPCIPTQCGMMKPEETYLPGASVFPDLPTVAFPKGTSIKHNMEKVLCALGLRKHVELQLVFTRMVTTGDWSIPELVKYLVQVKETLTPLELHRLRQTAAFVKEEPADPPQPQKSQRYTASQLYEPSEALRGLGLPILDWGAQPKWRANTEEAKFLFSLGLNRNPPLGELLKLAAYASPAVREAALKYFLNNHTVYALDYVIKNVSDIPFVPSVKPSGQTGLEKPTEVFVDSDSAIMGFSIIEPRLQPEAHKLKIAKQPPVSLIIPVLIAQPPSDSESASRIFAYLASRTADFAQSHFAQLRMAQIIPAGTPIQPNNTVRHIRPADCYIGQSSTDFHSALFTFVDFGGKANAFLRACGVKHEPTVQEIVQILIRDPPEFFRLAGGADGYLMELRNIATNLARIPPELQRSMQKTSMLLGEQRVQRKPSGVATKEPEYETECNTLLRPDQIVIVDDANAYALFADHLYGAPQEDVLEELYASLGSRNLSGLIQERYKPQGEIPNAQIAHDTRALILERLPLFLHEHRNVHLQPLIKLDWLAEGENFQVKAVSKLQLEKTLQWASQSMTKRLEASAAAFRDKGGRGSVQLVLAGNDKLDLYEVAHSICKLLFRQHRINDSLLFMTILSTDLSALRRRGYNVDRIMNQQRAAQRQALEARRRDAASRQTDTTLHSPGINLAHGPGRDDIKELKSDTPPGTQRVSNSHSRPTSSQTPPPIQAEDTLPSARESDNAPNPVPTRPATMKVANATGTLFNSFGSFRNKFQRSSSPLSNADGATLGDHLERPGKARDKAPRPLHNAQPHVTPISAIESNIQMALKGCREESASTLRSRQNMTTVKETVDGAYCDVSGHQEDFKLSGESNGYRVYVAQDTPNIVRLVADKKDALDRFTTCIVDPLRKIYRLPSSNIHIFYDTHGGLIAFNRNGSLFLNLRYYEAWHDDQVKAGDLRPGFISWYFTLAHEIAHNLVTPHNAEHEFYFSSICEHFLVDFTHMLASPSNSR